MSIVNLYINTKSCYHLAYLWRHIVGGASKL